MLVERVIGAMRGTTRVALRIRFATPVAQGPHTWRCTYSLAVDDTVLSEQPVEGVDGLQALWLALAIAEVEIDQLIASEGLVLDDPLARAELRAAHAALGR